MSFRLEHHNKIFTIFESLDYEILKKGSTYFCDGTLLALDFQEYRWSNDIDFLSSVSTGGYKYLRSEIFDNGYDILFHDRSKIKIGRSTTDQYGIRMIVFVDDLPIKLEVVAETRFQLDLPRFTEWSSVPCLSLIDCFTSKLLSNSDRYMDEGFINENAST